MTFRREIPNRDIDAPLALPGDTPYAPRNVRGETTPAPEPASLGLLPAAIVFLVYLILLFSF